MELSVVLPCFNEEKFIIQTLTRIESYLKENNFDYEIIVIDDNSTDSSYYKILSYVSGIGSMKNNRIRLFSNKKNQGKGFSIVRGLKESKKDYVLTLDTDLSSDISEVKKLLRNRKDNDLIIGSRYLKTSELVKKQSITRIFYSRAFNILVNLLFGLKVKDSQCGFKLYSQRLSKIIPKHCGIKKYSCDVEHLLICKVNGFNYKEIGIKWTDTKPQEVKFKQIRNMFIDLIKIKRNQMYGLYNVSDPFNLIS
jgi:dolichyl-phosphate beta-glucosyltransferase